jgi:peptide-methionine (S)-S-oxide reductase
MARTHLWTALSLLAVCGLGACRHTDQPEKKPTQTTDATKTVQPAKAAPSTETKANTPTTDTTKKDDKTMQQAPAATPLITKSHTLTKMGKELTDTKKLPANLQAATFGAGCFWGVESTFRKMPGIVATSVGFSGGKTQAPSYEQVCDKGTGHAEVVDVVYDPAVISYDKLLDTFFTNHNPAQVNRQGPDYGDQYRTVIFYHDDAQKAAAEKAKDALAKSGKWGSPIATQIVKFEHFWPAEEYHQTYLEKRGLDVCH